MTQVCQKNILDFFFCILKIFRKTGDKKLNNDKIHVKTLILYQLLNIHVDILLLYLC
jgi:hypothetical protein